MSLLSRSPCCKAPMVLLSSNKVKMCCDCTKKYDWRLEEGQESIFTDEIGGKQEVKDGREEIQVRDGTAES